MGILILIIIAVIVFYISRSFFKLKLKKRKIDFIEANDALPMLRNEAFRINAKLQLCAEERMRRQRREYVLNAVCDFFEELGADSMQQLRLQEREYANERIAAEPALQADYNRALKKIEKAQKMIQHGWK